MAERHLAIDVSEHQGKLDWEKIKAAGVELAVIRAGHHTGTADKTFAYNIAACEVLNIPYAVYWFSYAASTEEAVAEAKSALKACKGYDPKWIAFDWEYDSYDAVKARGVTITKALVYNIALAFCQTVSLGGIKPIVYTNIDYLNTYFGSIGFDKWVAQWPQTKDWAWKASPVGSSQYSGKHIMWQFGAWQGIPGTNGQVDADIYYGTLEEETSMTKAEVEALIEQKVTEKVSAALTGSDTKVSAWAKDELEAAKAAGITDGSRPGGYVTREQAAIMALRASKK